jgi:uncharacterized protein (TIGR03435 family)
MALGRHCIELVFHHPAARPVSARGEIPSNISDSAMKYASVAALLLLSVSSAILVQAQSKDLSFEVASVKLNHSGDNPCYVRIIPGGGLRAMNAPLQAVITTAYQIPDFELAGGSAWMTTERWDIEARGPGAAPPQQVLNMLRALLAERFQLKVHTEFRQMPIYALLVARSGPKLEPSRIECFDITAGIPPPMPSARPCGGFNRGPAQMLGARIAMPGLAKTLSKLVARTVVDKTGIDGSYDIMLDWKPDELLQPDQDPAASESASFFTAIQERLGLRLEAQKGPVEILVVDGVNRASAN